MKTPPERHVILIVDDQDDLRELLKLNLRYENFEIEEAKNGKEAIQKALIKPPDIILLDIMMPEMDGWQVYQALKDNIQTQNIPIIIITALDQQRQVAEQTMNPLNTDFLTRPVRRKELIERIKRLL